MDTRVQNYVKTHLSNILYKYSKIHFPSYDIRFSFVWKGYDFNSSVSSVSILLTANNHKCFVISNDMLEKFVEALQDCKEQEEFMSAIKDISISKADKHIIISFNTRTLVDSISKN